MQQFHRLVERHGDILIDRFHAAATEQLQVLAVPPNTVSQSMPSREGTSRTPSTNSRIVRPLEMRAMNMPTRVPTQSTSPVKCGPARTARPRYRWLRYWSRSSG